MFKILLLLVCVNQIFCAPSLSGCSLESEQQEVNSNENLNRVNRQIATQQVTITENNDSSENNYDSQDMLIRLQTLLSLMQSQPITLGGNQGGQIEPHGEFIIKLPFSLNPNCYATHFLKNPELLVLFQHIIKTCGGDPNLFLLTLNQANSGGLLGGLGQILGGGGANGGLLGGLASLLGVGPLQQGGGLLGGLGGILGGQPGGLLGGLGGLLGVSGGKGKNGLLGGLGGILGGQPGGLLGGVGGLLGTSSGGKGGKGGLVGGLLGGGKGGLVGGLLGGEKGGLVGGLLGGGKESSGGLLNGVLGGNSNSGIGGILSNNDVLGGDNDVASNLVGGLTEGITGGVLNGVVEGTVGGVVNGALGSVLSRRHASDEQFDDNENDPLISDIDSAEMEIPRQTSRPEFVHKTSQQRLTTNLIRPISSYNNEQTENDKTNIQNQHQGIENSKETSNDNAQLLDKQKPKRKYRRRKYKIVEPINRDLVDMPETQIQTTNMATDDCEHKMVEMNNFHRSFYNTMRPPVETVPSTNKYLLNEEY